MAEKLDFQCEDILPSKSILIHPQGSINKELLFPKQPPVTCRAADGTKNHICACPEWHPWIHIAAGACCCWRGITLCPQKSSSHHALRCIQPHCWYFSSEEYSRQGCKWKEIYCMWNWWIASYFTQLKSLLPFFTPKSESSLTLPLVILSPMPDPISNVQSSLSALGYRQDLVLVFSLWNREVNSVLGQLGHCCQFLFIISSTQLDVWNSQTLGETHVCLNFKSRLLAGNEWISCNSCSALPLEK